MKITTRAGSALAASALTLTLAACAGSGGSAIGYNEIAHAEADTLATACEAFFGTGEQVADRLGLDMDLEFDQENSRGAACQYGSEFDDRMLLAISEDKPEGDLVRAKGEKYYVALYAEDSEGEAWSGIADREKAKKWIEGRANAVTDDYDKWLASLPALEPGWSLGSLPMSPENEPGTSSSTMRTPWASVSVTPKSAKEFLTIGEQESRPADGEKFVVAGVSVSVIFAEGSDESQPAEHLPTYAITVDGEPFDAGTSLSALGETSQTQYVALSVPVAAKDVSLVVTSGSAAQAISLTSGDIADPSASELLEQSVSSFSDTTYIAPEVTHPDGRTRSLRYSYGADYSDRMAWSYSAWDDVAAAFADEGKAYFTVTLSPRSPEGSAPLATDSLAVTVNGQAYTAESFDPTAYSYRFTLPAGATRISAVLTTQVLEQSLLNEYWWQPGSTIGTSTQTWTIDPNHVQSATGW